MSDYSSSAEEAMERATMELAEDLQSQFRDRDQLYRDIDAVLFGNLEVQIPEAYRKTAIEVRSPMALDIATSVTAALSTNPMSVNFKPVGFGDVYQQNSTSRRAGCVRNRKQGGRCCGCSCGAWWSKVRGS